MSSPVVKSRSTRLLERVKSDTSMVEGSPRKHFRPASKSVCWERIGQVLPQSCPFKKHRQRCRSQKEREAEQAAAGLSLTFLQSSPQIKATWLHVCGPVPAACKVCSGLACPDARHHRLLLTAAVGADVLLQRRYVSVPAQGVNLLRVWRLAEENKGFVVGLGGAEPSQVAARGEVVIQGRCQRGRLACLKQEAKLKGCRNKSLHRITTPAPGCRRWENWI